MSAGAAPRRVWVLNLDAEHELEVGGAYTPSAHLAAIVERESRRLYAELGAAGDLVLDVEAPPLAAEDLQGALGLAWSPTPRARARLAAAGVPLAPAPSVEVLRQVNARPFAAAVRAPLAGASFEKLVVTTLEEALLTLARPAEAGWLARRTFGAAGRGRRRIAAGRVSTEDRAWLRASLRLGALVLEPWVSVTREFTRSAWVTPEGSVVISPPCFQETTHAGAWVRTETAERGAVARGDDVRLEAAVAAAGAALAAAGYFGPFGIDAFRHRAAHGEVLNPLSEINARFTMDWWTAMAHRGPAQERTSGLQSLLERNRTELSRRAPALLGARSFTSA